MVFKLQSPLQLEDSVSLSLFLLLHLLLWLLGAVCSRTCCCHHSKKTKKGKERKLTHCRIRGTGVVVFHWNWHNGGARSQNGSLVVICPHFTNTIHLNTAAKVLLFNLLAIFLFFLRGFLKLRCLHDHFLVQYLMFCAIKGAMELQLLSLFLIFLHLSEASQ